MDIFGANTSTYKWNGCAEFYIASEPPFLRMFGTLMTWWNLIFIDAKKSADILQFTECRHAFPNSCPLFLVPCSVFFPSSSRPTDLFFLHQHHGLPHCEKGASHHSPHISQGKLASSVARFVWLIRGRSVRLSKKSTRSICFFSWESVFLSQRNSMNNVF